MNDSPANRRAASAVDLRELNGRIVLVKTSCDHRNPRTGIRGWIEVKETAGREPVVCVAMEFPQMFSRPAHHRTIPLDDDALARLLTTERNGTFEFTIDDELA